MLNFSSDYYNIVYQKLLPDSSQACDSFFSKAGWSRAQLLKRTHFRSVLQFIAELMHKPARYYIKEFSSSI